MNQQRQQQAQQGRRPDRQDAQQGRGPDEGPPFWEWMIGVLGLLLLLASVGYLLYDAWLVHGEQPRPPAIQVQAVEEQGGRFVVRLAVRNEGRATAAGVRVEGELRRGDEVLESSELEFDYLPGQSSREGALVFSTDPRSLQLELSARSYRQP